MNCARKERNCHARRLRHLREPYEAQIGYYSRALLKEKTRVLELYLPNTPRAIPLKESDYNKAIELLTGEIVLYYDQPNKPVTLKSDNGFIIIMLVVR